MEKLTLKSDRRDTVLTLESGCDGAGVAAAVLNIRYVSLDTSCGVYLRISQARMLHDSLSLWIKEQESQRMKPKFRGRQ